MTEIAIVQLGPDEGERLKEVRLRALQESPDAFGSSYAREIGFSEDEWTKRLKNPDSRWWVAESRDLGDVGLV
ncbi:MAG: GNAT family N-acetyltransferase, partial [Nonomuraea sp.]|nr:GNAT family N-acetyltransferase [Nonomuraea sp.]